MRLIGLFSVLFLAIWVLGCADTKESEAPWQFPEEALTGTEIKSDSFSRRHLFLLYTVDGEYKDTLWFKPQNKPRWEHLFTIQAPDSPSSRQAMTLSCPGKEGHLEIHSQSAMVGQPIEMQLSDSTQYTDFFRIIDRRSPADSAMVATIYQGVNVIMELQGLQLYPIDSEQKKYSGHIALKFSGLFQSRRHHQLHEIEGFVGAW